MQDSFLVAAIIVLRYLSTITSEDRHFCSLTGSVCRDCSSRT
jgi:hypothetical protein